MITLRQFNKLSNLNQVKAIAADVFNRLSTRQIKPANRGYVRFDEKLEGKDVQQLLKKGERCFVCALGGATCSIIAMEDKVKTNEDGRVEIIDDDFYLRDRLFAILGSRTAHLMETTFEGCSYVGLSKSLSSSEHDACLAFHNRYQTPGARFRAIWKQLLKTGTFDPTK